MSRVEEEYFLACEKLCVPDEVYDYALENEIDLLDSSEWMDLGLENLIAWRKNIKEKKGFYYQDYVTAELNCCINKILIDLKEYQI